MRCIDCNGKVRVADIVHAPNNEVYRRRICPGCGRTFVTIEFEVDRDDIFKKAWNTYHRKNLSKKKEK